MQFRGLCQQPPALSQVPLQQSLFEQVHKLQEAHCSVKPGCLMKEQFQVSHVKYQTPLPIRHLGDG